MRIRTWAIVSLLSLRAAGCDAPDAVTVYTSVDAAISKPILDRYEEETGVAVRVVYDVEAQKTTGLYQRLLAERHRPRADLFWNSEVARTIQLAERGVLAPYRSGAASDLPPELRGRGDLWTGFSLRARVIVYNPERLGGRRPPRSIADLAAPRFREDAAMARPLFGTTATHVGALHAVLGRDGCEQFLLRLRANGVRLVDGNALVRNLVVRGDVTIGLTDTDDAHEALLRGDPLRIVFPDQEAAFPGRDTPLGVFAIPNTVALVAGGPEPDLARSLIDYLVSGEVEAALARSSAAQIPVRPGIERPRGLDLPEPLVRMLVPYEDVARGIEAASGFLRQHFVR